MALVGRIARAHGNRGQVIVNPDTDFPGERFRVGAELFVERNGAVEAMRVTSLRFHRERPIIGLAGVETMNDAEALAGTELRIPADRLTTLPRGTYYQHDLVGCRVELPDGGLVGSVREVEGGAGGYRLVVARAEGGDVLIPLADEICTTIDPASRRVVVNPPEGLLDLNR
jgi:16S rRNA processing protein RimM